MAVMIRLCQGKFSAETVDRIKKEVTEGCTTLVGKCGACKCRVSAESKHGEWVPKTHRVPLRHTSGAGKRMDK